MGSYLCRQTIGRRPHPFGLQHPKGKHFTLGSSTSWRKVRICEPLLFLAFSLKWINFCLGGTKHYCFHVQIKSCLRTTTSRHHTFSKHSGLNILYATPREHCTDQHSVTER